MKVIKKMMSTKKILSVAVVLLLGIGILSSTGCSSADFNVTGNWRVDFQLEGQEPEFFYLNFSGTKTTGVVFWDEQQAGNYSVTGDQVIFEVRIWVSIEGVNTLFLYSFLGYFDNDNKFSGAIVASLPEIPGGEESGPFTATRL